MVEMSEQIGEEETDKQIYIDYKVESIIGK